MTTGWLIVLCQGSIAKMRGGGGRVASENAWTPVRPDVIRRTVIGFASWCLRAPPGDPVGARRTKEMMQSKRELIGAVCAVLGAAGCMGSGSLAPAAEAAPPAAQGANAACVEPVAREASTRLLVDKRIRIITQYQRVETA